MGANCRHSNAMHESNESIMAINKVKTFELLRKHQANRPIGTYTCTHLHIEVIAIYLMKNRLFAPVRTAIVLHAFMCDIAYTKSSARTAVQKRKIKWIMLTKSSGNSDDDDGDGGTSKKQTRKREWIKTYC